MAYLFNATFARDTKHWVSNNHRESVTISYINSTDARSGKGYMRIKSSAIDGSVVSDTFNVSQPSIGCLAYVRSHTGTPLKGAMKLWGVDKAGLEDENQVEFALKDSQWTLIMGAINVVDPESNPRIKVEFYLHSTGVELDIDTVVVC